LFALISKKLALHGTMPRLLPALCVKHVERYKQRAMGQDSTVCDAMVLTTSHIYIAMIF
jgi:hypothetical protein